MSSLLERLGLGREPENQQRGLLNRIIHLLTGAEQTSTEADPANRNLLLFAQPIDQLPVVDNYRWNRQASESTWLAVVWWWFVVALLGWAVWPLVFTIFRTLRDRGYLLSRTVGWLLAGWLLWLLASVGGAMNTVVNAWLTLALLAVIGAAIALWQWNEMRTFLRKHWGLLLFSEGLFAIAYLCFIAIRIQNPDLWHPWRGGEKFMELAFLNGILRSPSFPPVDPHFAGGFINYYYFGLYLVAYLVKLTGIYAEVAFNLAIPTLFALTVTNTYAIAYSGIHGQHPRWWRGVGSALLAPFFVALLGNLDGFAQLVRQLMAFSSSSFQSSLPGVSLVVHAINGFANVSREGHTLPSYDFWSPSRVLEPTINEFPYWSFLFADLHPHLIGIPFAALLLALLLALFLDQRLNRWRACLYLLCVGFLLGTTTVINLWDLPTYAGLGILGLLVLQFARYGRIFWLATIGATAVLLGVAYLTYQPFFANFTSVIVGGIGLVEQPDPLGLWLLIWACFGFLQSSWALWQANSSARLQVKDQSSSKPSGVERWLSLFFRQFDRLPRFFYLHNRIVQQPRLAYLALTALWPTAIMVALFLLLLTNYTVLALCLLFLVLSFLLLWRRGPTVDASSLYVSLLTVTGWAILAGTQLFYLKDHLQDQDAYRMNTLFKFFNQVWVIWGVAAAIALPRLWQGLIRRRLSTDSTEKQHRRALAWPTQVQRIVWVVVLLTMLMASTVYLLLGTPARLEQRFPGWQPEVGTLNGMAYMQQGVYTWNDHTIALAHDYTAIQWLLANVRGNAVIVEAAETFYYLSGGTRVASLTGLSGLNGLHTHEQRWHDQVSERAWLHHEFWATPDLEHTLYLIRELNISLIYVGELERHLHAEGVAKLAEMAERGWLTPLYENEGVTIYGLASD